MILSKNKDIQIQLFDSLHLKNEISTQLNHASFVHQINVVASISKLLNNISNTQQKCVIITKNKLNEELCSDLLSFLQRNRHIPVILITKKIDSGTEEQLYSQGLDYYLDINLFKKGLLPYTVLYAIKKHNCFSKLLISENKYANYFKKLRTGALKTIYAPETPTGYLTVEGVSELNDDEKMMMHLKKAAYYDYLTQIPNRKYFDNVLQREISRAQRTLENFYLCIIDVDHFKSINDTYGHDVGDQMLKEFASRLHTMIRGEDFCARLSGDEFAIIFINVPMHKTILELTKRLQDVLTKPYLIMSKKLYVTMSIGVTLYDSKSNLTFNQLMKAADSSLYKAKDNGRNQTVFFDEQAELSNVLHQKIENALQTAIDKREFKMLYQPVLGLDTMEAQALEALVRWDSSVLKRTVMPEEFISIAENSGKIIEISDIILDLVLSDIRKLLNEGCNVPPVSINFSVLEFMANNFVERLDTAMKKYSLPPSQIQVEVPEVIIVEHYQQASDIITQLREKQYLICIDNFGKAFAELKKLTHVDFTSIKIDQDFIKNMLADTSALQVVRAGIELAKKHNIQAIAKGVEDEDELEFLRDWKCHLVQGYYFSRPLERLALSLFINKHAVKTIASRVGSLSFAYQQTNYVRNLGHDMNNLLTGILGYTEIILQQVPALTDDYNAIRAIHIAISSAVAFLTSLSFEVKSIQDELEKVSENADSEQSFFTQLSELEAIAIKYGKRLVRSQIQIEYSILPILNNGKHYNLSENVQSKLKRIMELSLHVKVLNEKLIQFNYKKLIGKEIIKNTWQK